MFPGESPAITWKPPVPVFITLPEGLEKKSPGPAWFIEHCLIGDGYIPHQEIDEVSKNGNYREYLSLE